VVRLGIGKKFSKSRAPEEILTASGYAGGPTIFFCADREKGIKIFQDGKIRLCPTDDFLQSPAKSAFKRLILKTPLCQHLLLTMSSIPVTKLTDQECKKGQLTQWP